VLGPPKLRALDQPVTVSLEQLVPADHFYRHLDAALDLSFVREWVADLYGACGRPSVDPIVFFKLQLILFFEGLRSERRLIETASLHLAHRWYLGYGLDEPLPDHSSLTRIRQRLGVAAFERFFEHVVELWQQAGLIWGRELLFDATKIRANAALGSVVSPGSTSRLKSRRTSIWPRSSPTSRRPSRTRPRGPAQQCPTRRLWIPRQVRPRRGCQRGYSPKQKPH
jgi:transposase